MSDAFGNDRQEFRLVNTTYRSALRYGPFVVVAEAVILGVVAFLIGDPLVVLAVVVLVVGEAWVLLALLRACVAVKPETVVVHQIGFSQRVPRASITGLRLTRATGARAVTVQIETNTGRPVNCIALASPAGPVGDVDAEQRAAVSELAAALGVEVAGP